MNSDPQSPNSSPESPATVAIAPPPLPVPPRRNGKIAHLPKDQQNAINTLLNQGATYKAVRLHFAAQGVDLNEQNISDWYHGGYQDYLQQQERLVELRAAQDRLLELARTDGAPNLSFAGLQLAVTQLSQQLYELSPGAHKQTLETDTNQYLRMLNTLARMSKALLSLQLYQDQIAQARSTELKKRDLDTELLDSEYDLLTQKMDQVFRMPRRRRGNADLSRSGGTVSPPPTLPAEHSQEITPASSSSHTRNADFQSAVSQTSSLQPAQPQEATLVAPGSSVPQFEVQSSEFKVQSSEPAVQSSCSSVPLVDPEPSTPPLTTLPDSVPHFEVRSSEFKVQSSEPAVQSSGSSLPPAASDPPVPCEISNAETTSVPPITNQNSKFQHPPLPLKSKISNLKSQDTEEPPVSETPEPPASPPSIQNPKSKIQNSPEHCLECGALLPKLLPNGGRPRQYCDQCSFDLPPPGCRVDPSLEQCPNCRANLPRPLLDGHRPTTHCHHCGRHLPPPVPTASAPPDTPTLQAA